MSQTIDPLAATELVPVVVCISKGSERASLLKLTAISVAIMQLNAINPDKTVTTPVTFCSLSKLIFEILGTKIYSN